MPDTSASPSFPKSTRLRAWPWIVALLIVGGLAAYWKEDLNSLKRKHSKLQAKSVEGAYRTTSPSVSFIKSIRDALEDRGIQLTVVAMPYREDLYPDRESSTDSLFEVPGFDANTAWIALQRLRHDGIKCVDLWTEFHQAAKSGIIYDDDLCHLHEDVSDSIGEAIYQKLNASDTLNDREHVTVIGECFAGTFGEILEERAATEKRGMNFEILRGSADRGRIPNQMFRFDDVYLKGCDQVVWVLPYLMFQYDKFPPLVTDPPPVGDLIEHRVTIRITQGLALDAAQMKEAVESMPYPDAVAELEFEVVDGDHALPGLQDGKGILLAWVARDRERAGAEHLESGQEFYCSLFEWNAYIGEKPDMAREFLLRPLDDFEKPRFWLQSWIRR